MTKWEYNLFVHDTDGGYSLIEQLNTIGSAGWEAVSISGLRTNMDNSFHYQEIIAKRCISPNETTNSSSPTIPESC